MVLQTPLLHLLRKRFGRPCLLITSGPWTRPLLDGSEDIANIWQLRHRHRPLLLSPERWRLIAGLRRCAGPIYVSEDSIRQLPKIRRIFALAGVTPDRCLFLTDQAIVEQHWVDRLLRFGAMTPLAYASQYTVAAEDVWMAPRLTVRTSDRLDRDAWLHRHRMTYRTIVLVQAGHKRVMKWGRARAEDRKAWPIAHWALLLRAIHAAIPGACVLLCGSESEEKLLAEIRDTAQIEGVNVATRNLPLGRLLALMEVAHSVISVDSGPSHMAAAVGCPLVVLYGAESPSVWGRRSPSGSPIVELGGPPTSCATRDISPDAVIAAWTHVAATRQQHASPARPGEQAIT
jgi:hypothetical protein